MVIPDIVSIDNGVGEGFKAYGSSIEELNVRSIFLSVLSEASEIS